MTRLLAILLLATAVAAAIVGGAWGLMKGAGGEVDYCRGGDCTSGWYGAGALLAVSVAAAIAGVALLRRRRRDER